MLTRCELEGMYEDTGGVRVRRVRRPVPAAHEVHDTWGHLESVPVEEFAGPAAVSDRVTQLRMPTDALPELSVGDELETRAQEPTAPWLRWSLLRPVVADESGIEIIAQLTRR